MRVLSCLSFFALAPALISWGSASPVALSRTGSDVEAMITPAPTPDGSRPAKRVPGGFLDILGLEIGSGVEGAADGILEDFELLLDLTWINDIRTMELESSALSSKAASITSYLAGRKLSTLGFEVTARSGLHIVMMQNASTNSVPTAGSGTMSSFPSVTPFICMTTAASTVTVPASPSATSLLVSATQGAPTAATAMPSLASAGGKVGQVITTTVGGVPLPFVQHLTSFASQPTTAAFSPPDLSSANPTTTFQPQLRVRNATEATPTASTSSVIACPFDSLNGRFLAVDSKGDYVVMVRDSGGSLLSSIFSILPILLRRDGDGGGVLAGIIGDPFAILGV